MEPAIGIEPITYRLQGGCSANWAKLAQKSTVGLVFKSIKCFRNSSLFPSCVSLFNHSNLSGLINSLKYFTQILNSQSSFSFNTFKKFFHSHFHSKFEIIISLCENLWSIHSFDSWLLNWHWKYKLDIKSINSPRVGLEPTTQWLTATCSTDWAISDWRWWLLYWNQTHFQEIFYFLYDFFHSMSSFQSLSLPNYEVQIFILIR